MQALNSPRRRFRFLLSLVAVAAIALVGLGVIGWIEPSPAAPGCNPCGAPPLTLSPPISSWASGSLWVYNFTSESEPGIALAELTFEVKSATGQLEPLHGVCVAGPGNAALGSWNESWAGLGDSSECSPSASHPPGQSTLSDQDTLIVYFSQNTVEDSFWVFGTGPFLGACGVSF
jgi:hypothetical protein